jgi:hypothetical protein
MSTGLDMAGASSLGMATTRFVTGGVGGAVTLPMRKGNKALLGGSERERQESSIVSVYE